MLSWVCVQAVGAQLTPTMFFSGLGLLFAVIAMVVTSGNSLPATHWKNRKSTKKEYWQYWFNSTIIYALRALLSTLWSPQIKQNPLKNLKKSIYRVVQTNGPTHFTHHWCPPGFCVFDLSCKRSVHLCFWFESCGELAKDCSARIVLGQNNLVHFTLGPNFTDCTVYSGWFYWAGLQRNHSDHSKSFANWMPQPSISWCCHKGKFVFRTHT